MDYRIYHYKTHELVGDLLLAMVLSGIIAYFFYRSIAVFFCLMAGLPLFLRNRKKDRICRRKKKLAQEFTEMLECVSAGVAAGYSLENSFVEAYNDIVRFYGKESMMAGEIIRIRKGLSLNVTLEELMADLAKRSGLEDIRVFSEVFGIAKRNGGNVNDVLQNTAHVMKDKMSLENEIDVLIAEKKMEFGIMEVIPFLILMYIGTTSKGYFDILYGNVKGVVFMTICLAVYLGAVVIGSRIVNINV